MENTIPVVKKTKAMYFEELRELIMAAVEDQELQNEYLEFIDKQMDVLDRRKIKAAERQAKKREESDTLTDVVFAQISEEPMTADEVVLAIDDEEVTRSKVIARLSRLVKNGSVTKETVKVDGKTRMAYRLAITDEGDVEISETTATVIED